MDRVLNLVDANTDGRITLDEVELEAERMKQRVMDVAAPIARFCGARRPWLQAGIGWVTLFYGGHFKQTMLFYCGFETTQREVLLAQLGELTEMYSAARSKIRQDYGEVVLVDSGDARSAAADASAAGASSRQKVPLSLVLYRAVDPQRFLSVARCLYSGLCVGLAATMNESAAKLGLGVQLGRRLADVVSPAVERLACPPARPGEDRPPPDPWVLLAVESACTGAGLLGAYLLKGWAALWTTANLGSNLLVNAVLDILGEQIVPPESQLFLALQTSKMVLAGYGFLSQLEHWGSAPIPWYLLLPLAPARIAEAALTFLAAQAVDEAHRSPGFTSIASRA